MTANYVFDNWNSKNHRPSWSYEQPRLSSQCSNPSLLQTRLKRNNIHFLRQAQTNMGVPCFWTYSYPWRSNKRPSVFMRPAIVLP